MAMHLGCTIHTLQHVLDEDTLGALETYRECLDTVGVAGLAPTMVCTDALVQCRVAGPAGCQVVVLHDRLTTLAADRSEGPVTGLTDGVIAIRVHIFTVPVGVRRTLCTLRPVAVYGIDVTVTLDTLLDGIVPALVTDDASIHLPVALPVLWSLAVRTVREQVRVEHRARTMSHGAAGACGLFLSLDPAVTVLTPDTPLVAGWT